MMHQMGATQTSPAVSGSVSGVTAAIRTIMTG